MIFTFDSHPLPWKSAGVDLAGVKRRERSTSAARGQATRKARKVAASRADSDASQWRDVLRNAAMLFTDAAQGKTQFDAGPTFAVLALASDQRKRVEDTILSRMEKEGAITHLGGGVYRVHDEEKLVDSVLPYLN